ncbi:DUF3419 family protein [Actinocorallia sp. B10E7]|uniref:DUF3419 family protein n=1 Tax=Actinocorallia sp. B10E7 TaxID=3153558 RepID=UPI00325EBCCE
MLTRTSLPGAVDDRLYFAQVREDPRLELEALKDRLHGRIALVTSGGCTALTLLAEGAREVVGVDMNRAQNHITELKALAVSRLGPEHAARFLGGLPAEAAERIDAYGALRRELTGGARAYWDGRRREVTSGVLDAGVTERLMRVIARYVRWSVHPRAVIEELLLQDDPVRQREFYDRTWNNARWRFMFRVLCGRLAFRRTYDPAFFTHIENPSFALHFHGTAERALRELPIGGNYFLRHLFTGLYSRDATPAYLKAEHASRLAEAADRLSLVDASFEDYLRTQPDGSLDGFVLSNICEWLSQEQIDGLFAEIVRTAAPGARLVFRNFVGWTEVPARWSHAVVEDRALGQELIRLDRSLCQRRIAVCDVRGEGL